MTAPRTPSRTHPDADAFARLVTRVAAGDRQAFATLYDLLAPPVCTIAAQRGADGDVVVLAVFERLWRTAPAAPTDGRQVRRWVLAAIGSALPDRPAAEPGT